jgi:hypothetical protein
MKQKFYFSRFRKPTKEDEPFLIQVGRTWTPEFYHTTPLDREYIWTHAPVSPTEEQLISNHEGELVLRASLVELGKKIPKIQSIWMTDDQVLCLVAEYNSVWLGLVGAISGCIYAAARGRTMFIRTPELVVTTDDRPFAESPELVYEREEVEWKTR